MRQIDKIIYFMRIIIGVSFWHKKINLYLFFWFSVLQFFLPQPWLFCIEGKKKISHGLKLLLHPLLKGHRGLNEMNTYGCKMRTFPVMCGNCELSAAIMTFAIQHGQINKNLDENIVMHNIMIWRTYAKWYFLYWWLVWPKNISLFHFTKWVNIFYKAKYN